MFLVLAYFGVTAWRFLSKGPDFEHHEVKSSTEQLIQVLINEINTALSLNQDEVTHKFNPAEPPIDGEVAADVTFKIAQVVPCVVLFYYQLNLDVRIVLRKLV